MVGVGDAWTLHFDGAVPYRHLFLLRAKAGAGKGKPGKSYDFERHFSLSFCLPAIIKGQGLVTCVLPCAPLPVQPVTFESRCFAPSTLEAASHRLCVQEGLLLCSPAAAIEVERGHLWEHGRRRRGVSPSCSVWAVKVAFGTIFKGIQMSTGADRHPKGFSKAHTFRGI